MVTNSVTPFEPAAAEKIINEEIAKARDFLGEDAMSEDAAGATALLPILNTLQAEFGAIDRAAIPLLGEALNISQAEVRGTISFYHDYRNVPAGRATLRLCRAEACQALGGERIAAYLASRHNLHPGETTTDGAVTLQNTYCLGNCALGPAAMLDDKLVGRVDEDRADALLRGGER